MVGEPTERLEVHDQHDADQVRDPQRRAAGIDRVAGAAQEEERDVQHSRLRGESHDDHADGLIDDETISERPEPDGGGRPRRRSDERVAPAAGGHPGIGNRHEGPDRCQRDQREAQHPCTAVEDLDRIPGPLTLRRQQPAVARLEPEHEHDDRAHERQDGQTRQHRDDHEPEQVGPRDQTHPLALGHCGVTSTGATGHRT